MKRSYSLDQYQKTINLIREKIPYAAITTDIMVGFPGESDEEFEQSYSFCQQAGFANIHVFPFSPRPDTAAASMPRQIKTKSNKSVTSGCWSYPEALDGASVSGSWGKLCQSCGSRKLSPEAAYTQG